MAKIPKGTGTDGNKKVSDTAKNGKQSDKQDNQKPDKNTKWT